MITELDESEINMFQVIEPINIVTQVNITSRAQQINIKQLANNNNRTNHQPAFSKIITNLPPYQSNQSIQSKTSQKLSHETMQRSSLHHFITQSAVVCRTCNKSGFPHNHLIVEGGSHCYECVKQNKEMLAKVSMSYKDYWTSKAQKIPIPDQQSAQQCIRSLQEMKRQALKITTQLKKNIQEFQFDMLEFYTEAKSMCEAYTEKLHVLASKSIEEVFSQQHMNQARYTYSIKAKYKISCQIKAYLEQLKVKIPSIKELTRKSSKESKRHSICEVPIHSAIEVRGMLYFGTADGRIIFEDQNKWKQVKAHDSLIRSLTHDGQWVLYSGSDDFKIKAWDMRKRHELKLLNEFGTHEQLKSYHRDMLVFNRGKTMASTRGTHDQFKIRLWDLGSYKCTNALSGHTNYIRGMTMLNQDEIITVSDDRTLRVWNVKSPGCSRVFYHSKKIFNVHSNKEKDLICIYDQDNRAMVLDNRKLHQVQCWAIGKKVLCSQGKARVYFGLSFQIVGYSWFGIKQFTYALDVNFLPGTMLQIQGKLIACDGKGKVLEIPFEQQQTKQTTKIQQKRARSRGRF